MLTRIELDGNKHSTRDVRMGTKEPCGALHAPGYGAQVDMKGGTPPLNASGMYPGYYAHRDDTRVDMKGGLPIDQICSDEKHPHGDDCLTRTESPVNQSTLDLELIQEAFCGRSGPDAQKLAEIGLGIVAMLLRKNKDYGCSAWSVPVLAPGMTPRQAIQCRMSDKISRLNTLLSGETALVKESIEDTMHDLSGYGILWLGAPEDSAK